MTFRSNFSIFVLIICLTLNISGQNSLQKEIEKLRNDPAFRHAAWSVCVLKVADGSEYASYNADMVLIPASALKVATTYPVWTLLGPEFRFRTILEYDGVIADKSVIEGSIYIRGDGDPSLGSERFKETGSLKVMDTWVKALVKMGIHEVHGSVIADAGILGDAMVSPSWIWGDIGNYYGAGVCGLNFRENQYEVVFRPGPKAGDPAKVLRIEPPVKGIEMVNHVHTGPAGSGDQVVIYGGPYDMVRRLEGTVPVDSPEFVVRGSVPDPPLWLAQTLADHLSLAGVSIKNPATTITRLLNNGNHISQTRTAIDTVYSPKLTDIIMETHHKSVNIFCDALLMKLAQVKNGSGTLDEGIILLKSFWKGKGVDIEGMDLKDGSGLSPLNRISSRQLAGMTCQVALDKKADEYIKTLNLAGRTGDLKSLFTGSPAENNLRAKSGYMKDVRSYAGLVKNTKGEKLAFSIIINYYNGPPADLKKKLEKLMILMAASGE